MSASQIRLLVIILVATIGAPGCAWFDSLRGDGFQNWNQTMGGGIRGADPNAQSSGFFTDRRSEQIEKNLGGGY
jgi:hypothetical protein